MSITHQIEHQRRKGRASAALLLCLLGLAACSSGDGEENAGDGGGAGRNVGPNGLLSTDKAVYGPSEPIRVTFNDAPGNNGADWIAIYQRGKAPHYGSLAYRYIGGGEKGGPAPSNGTVVIDDGAVGTRITWPFPAGDYTAWYLVNDEYSSLGSVDFSTTCPSSAPGCDTAGFGKPSGGDEGCTADSDCGSCQRCERSSGRCIARLTC
jgi:hypothetical protein